jgi:hypothetical protein
MFEEGDVADTVYIQKGKVKLIFVSEQGVIHDPLEKVEEPHPISTEPTSGRLSQLR